jgi:hypothetical protein
MSTKITVAYAEKTYHLFREVFDDFSDDPRHRGRLWLDLDGVDFSVKSLAGGKTRVTVELTPVVVQGLTTVLTPEGEKLESLAQHVAHLLWCLENELTDIEGAKHSVKNLLPEGSLARFNKKWGD